MPYIPCRSRIVNSLVVRAAPTCVPFVIPQSSGLLSFSMRCCRDGSGNLNGAPLRALGIPVPDSVCVSASGPVLYPESRSSLCVTALPMRSSVTVLSVSLNPSSSIDARDTFSLSFVAVSHLACISVRLASVEAVILGHDVSGQLKKAACVLRIRE